MPAQAESSWNTDGRSDWEVDDMLQICEIRQIFLSDLFRTSFSVPQTGLEQINLEEEMFLGS